MVICAAMLLSASFASRMALALRASKNQATGL